MTNKEMILSAVEALGYTPKIDEDGDIVVRFQLKEIYLLSRNDEEPYVMVLLPQFLGVDEGDESSALVACNKLTRELKLAKVYVDNSFKTVSACCDFFFTDEESLKLGIEHSLSLLGVVRSKFQAAIEELNS